MSPTHPQLALVSRLLLPLAILLAAPSVPSALAGYQSATFTFDISNVFGAGSYGTVLAESYTGPSGSIDHDLIAGQVRFTVTADFIPVYGDPAAASNFGIQKFGFNTDLNPYPGDIAVTTTGGIDLGWQIQHDQNVSMFGVFSVEAQGTGKTRENPIVVTISDLGSDATLNHFLFLSSPHNGSVPAYFVAHVAGFNECGDPGPILLTPGIVSQTDCPCDPTSHYIAVTGDRICPVPVPPGIALALLGGAGIGLQGWRRRRTAG